MSLLFLQMKDLKRQLQQMQKREEKLQEQLTALRTGSAGTSIHIHMYIYNLWLCMSLSQTCNIRVPTQPHPQAPTSYSTLEITH